MATTFEPRVGNQTDQAQQNNQNPFGPPGKSSFRERVKNAPQAPPVCDYIASTIPPSIYGMERVRFTAQQVMILEESQRGELHNLAQHFMKHMQALGASDIAAGGLSCKGNIWMRVDGINKARPEMGTYTLDEINIICLSLLSEAQTHVLLDRYSVDYSYQMQAGNDGGAWHRFRMTLYMDNDSLAWNVRAISNELRPLASIGFHPTIQKGLMFDHVRDGLTLITGVTGSR